MSVLANSNVIGSGTSGGIDTGDIGHSLRCRSAASAYLSRTFGAPTDNRKYTVSGWIKRGKFGTAQAFFPSKYTDASQYTLRYFNTSDQIVLSGAFSGLSYALTTTSVFRDPTSALHVVLVFDSNNATAALRCRLYVNGIEQTLTGTSVPSGQVDFVNTANTSYIGADLTATDYLDGYPSRVCMVDGQALTPSSFGYLNTEINEWVSKSQSAVKAVVDAGGTNSFMLDFDDATSLTTLGYDKSSKGNNWTLNNFSLTAGTTYDHMLDVPGNSYATLNPICPSAANITNGNLTSGTTAVRGTMNALTYDSKWEVTAGGSAVTAGVISATGTTNTTSVTANKTFAFRLTTTGALDYKNVTDAGSWTSITTGLTGEQYPYGITQAANWNFGQAPLHASATYQAAAGGYFYDTTTGFKALCQANLPTPAILNPKLHFDSKTRTGTAATYSVTGLGFQPDLVWSKSRGRAVDHALYDSVRGVQKQLESNSTGAETTETTGLTAFNSDGYTGGALDQINGTTATNSFVDWLWKAGGAAVSNTAGSITSQVSANVDAGFSIVTYTGTGANATVGHGLTKVPKLVIIKQRTAGTVENWAVSHASIANTEYLLLNTTAAKTAGATYWNSTTPTTSVFSVGSAADTNESAKDFVAYCFADIEGYSKAFSYTGNGSADGPYVHLGFKPRWILIKRTDAVASWRILDTTRSTYNVMGEELYPNLTNAGTVFTALDTTADGIKLRTSDPTYNSNTATYIGFAIADVAGKYSLGR